MKMNDSVCGIVKLRDFVDAIPRHCRLFVVIHGALLLCNDSVREKWDASRTSGDRHLRYYFKKLIVIHTRWRWKRFFITSNSVRQILMSFNVKVVSCQFQFAQKCNNKNRILHTRLGILYMYFFLCSFPVFFLTGAKLY